MEAVGKQPWFVFPTASFGSDDWAGGVVYANQNLFGRDVQVISAGQIGQSRSYAFVGYRDPLVVGAPLTYSMSALYRREQIRLFANHSLVTQVPTTIFGGDAQIGWVLSPHTRAFLGLSARHQAVEPSRSDWRQTRRHCPTIPAAVASSFCSSSFNTTTPAPRRDSGKAFFSSSRTRFPTATGSRTSTTRSSRRGWSCTVASGGTTRPSF